MEFKLLACVAIVALCSLGSVQSSLLFPISYFSNVTYGNEKLTYDVEYYVNIEIGSERQKFMVTFDPASKYLWVPSVNCSSPSCQNHHKYNGNESATFIDLHQKASENLVAGELGKDTVRIGEFVEFALANQTFGQALSQNDILTNAKIDGVIGLSLLHNDTLVDTMFEHGLINKRVVSFLLSGSRFKWMLIGGTSPAFYAGPISYVNVTSNDWLFTLDQVTAASSNDTSAFKACGDDCSASISFVVPYVTGPAEDIKKLNDLLGANATSYFFPGDLDLNKLPEVTFTIGNTSFSLSPNDYVHKLSHNVSFSLFANNYDPSEKSWTLGGPFVRKYNTIFDRDNRKLGLALGSGAASSLAMSALTIAASLFCFVLTRFHY